MQDRTAEDRRVREKLERASPSGARANVAAMLNKMAQADAGRELPGLTAIERIRAGQKLGYRTAVQHNLAHARFEKAAAEVRPPPASACCGYYGCHPISLLGRL